MSIRVSHAFRLEGVVVSSAVDEASCVNLNVQFSLYVPEHYGPGLDQVYLCLFSLYIPDMDQNVERMLLHQLRPSSGQGHTPKWLQWVHPP